MKKLFALILAAVMCVSAAACSSVDGDTSSPAVSSAVTADTSGGTSAKSTSGSAAGVSFSNEYGTATTKCAHSGCDNYIASSGDTNCCTTHSNKCLECGKYIDEDAFYCISCLTNAAGKSTSGSSSNKGGNSYSGSSSSSSKCHYKEGGKEVCNSPCESGSNFCSYHTKYLNGIYNSLGGN